MTYDLAVRIRQLLQRVNKALLISARTTPDSGSCGSIMLHSTVQSLPHNGRYHWKQAGLSTNVIRSYELE
jgi:hypothetical protein